MATALVSQDPICECGGTSDLIAGLVLRGEKDGPITGVRICSFVHAGIIGILWRGWGSCPGSSKGLGSGIAAREVQLCLQIGLGGDWGGDWELIKRIGRSLIYISGCRTAIIKPTNMEPKHACFEAAEMHYVLGNGRIPKRATRSQTAGTLTRLPIPTKMDMLIWGGRTRAFF